MVGESTASRFGVLHAVCALCFGCWLVGLDGWLGMVIGLICWAGCVGHLVSWLSCMDCVVGRRMNAW